MVRLQTNLVYYSFTILLRVRCGSGRFRILSGCVRRASPCQAEGSSVGPAPSKSSQSINAFLTLTAVTKW
jgi:hypothetical protein